ncbi:MAG: lasso peptide biosynthesis B2 protein [Longimicrobiales bacterium]
MYVMIRSAKHLVGRFLELPFREKHVLFHAAAVLVAVRWVVEREGVAPFRDVFAEVPHSELDSSQKREVRRIARLVQNARHLVPGRCTCLHVALAAQRLLRNHRIAAKVRIGVRKQDDALQAHAWIQAGEDVVALRGHDVDRTYSVFPGLARGAPARTATPSWSLRSRVNR